jgi:hypothetical protein
MERKAQGTLEFLMSYSWALIIIGIALAALVALGIFNPLGFGASSGQTGFSNVAPVTEGFDLDTSGNFSIKLRNTAGVAVKLWSIQGTYVETGTSNTLGIAGTTLNSGEESSVYTVTGFGTPSSGSRYTMDVVVSYEASGINQSSTGRVYGTV